MKFFSIDYRSPPSGMGQIIDTRKPEKIGNQWNYLLVSYSGNGMPHDPSYVMTKFFESAEAEDQGWVGPILKDVIQFLLDQGVTHVQDGELAYEYEGGNEEDIWGLFTLDRWAEIMLSFM